MLTKSSVISEKIPLSWLKIVKPVQYFSSVSPVESSDSWQKSQLSIRSQNALRSEDAERHQRNIQRVLKYAKAAAKISNYSHRHYSAMVVTENGLEGMGANFEASRQVSTCDLRAALSDAYRQQVQNKVADPDSSSAPMRVKTVYLVNADVYGDQPIPCADCQDLLNSEFFAPDTEVVGLHYDAERNENFIDARPLKSILPLHKGDPRPALTTDKSIRDLPVILSPLAEKSLKKSNGALSHSKLTRLLQKAQLTYEENETAEYSKKKTGASVMIAPFHLMMSGARFEWSTRWFESPDLMSAAQGFQQTHRLQQVIKMLPKFVSNWFATMLQMPKIEAVAYYGDDSNLPPIASLGRIGRRRGGNDTLIVTVEQDQVWVRTIADYMPEMYQTKTLKNH